MLYIFFTIKERYNFFTYTTKQVFKQVNKNFLIKTFFLPQYYKQNDMLWQEGFYLDFVQKKILDK